MSELSEYVDGLFSKYGKSRRTCELKTEILGNLESKKADLVAGGTDEKEALRITKESLDSIDFLIDGNKQVYFNRMRLEFRQQLLIAVLAGWILTIPLLVFHIGLAANLILFVAAVIVGACYLALMQKAKNDKRFLEKKRYVNITEYKKRKKIIWILWAIFAAVSLLATTALRFGSNIWFSRHISIDGPYALAVLLIDYFIPMLTVIIPVAASIPLKLIYKYEAGECDEK